MNYEVIKGDLLDLAKQGEFDVIAHGCNCFGKQKSGIAKQMVQEFGTDKFEMESESLCTQPDNINKLGIIDWVLDEHWKLTVVNCYTQYSYGTEVMRVDYDALRLCLRKIDYIFPFQHIGLPTIGCGLAGGSWSVVERIIKEELRSMKVTVVIYDK